MTAKYFAILTNQGAARLANAAALGTKLNLTQMAVGDANGVLPTPDPAQTKLINQKRIAPLNLLTVDPANTSQIIAEQIIPENEGGFWIREIGLYDDDGILIAVANCPETYKPELQEGSGRTQTIRMILIVSSTSAITLKIDPSVVLATRQYVDDKVIEVKSYADGLMRAHEQSRNHPDATTTAKGFTQLNSSVTDDRETQSATPKAVKIAMDNANARLAKERNLSDLPNPALARQNLQLGDSSTKNTGTTANTVAAGDDARITGAMQKSQNGADIQDVAKFLQNLGLGDASGYVGRLLKIQVFYSSGIYNPTPGTKKVIVEMVGGGGGSAGARAAGDGHMSVGGSGGAGSYGKGQFTSNFNGVLVTVGGKGQGGTVSGAYATDGGGSSFGSLLTAAGGSAGQPAGPTNNFPFSTVAAVVSAGANGANIVGTPGQGALPSVVVGASSVIEGPGGSSQFGSGGFITAFNAKGVNGSGFGSGGGPSKVNGGNAAVAGGDGSQGLVIVWEYA
ncbi:phage tail protein [Klebsiella pneumoniae]|uniref:phage tail-collar fiber domain-containing protein n=1 Tax=Klebsiella pneumoniae TaxID=573 RepID=UPI001B8BB0E1|nr:phage tail protein [Klebsiella pneumoniae]MBQ5141459.1 phage tail protein [Klebsiella pneumoniae]MCM5796923.1 phage tail protein [Klebsiella pneumoniae]